MKEQLEHRLAALQAEHEAGQKMLADLAQKRATLEKTLLRISGAIQVLEEELGQATPPPHEVAAPALTPHENGALETL